MPKSIKGLGKTGRLFLLLGSAWLLLVGATSLVAFWQLPDATQQAIVAGDDWGAEALEVVGQQAQQFSPIAIANACGLGASSCFRCHNGKRADAPDTTPELGLWHQQHSKVNYSCTGCHQGNPRILKQEIAHKNLIVDPRQEVEKTCGSCHNAADVHTLVNTYSALASPVIEQIEKVN